VPEISRTKLFVSYAHADRDWMERLENHLAVLGRRGILHVWSDRQIAVGENWPEEIDAALTVAKVAVLLITPAFLASRYVWDHEMPRIIAHQEKGMRVLPIVARPCAWRLCDELAALQARPLDGRALALGHEAQIDFDLATFVYELAGLLNVVPKAMSNDDWVRLSTRSEPISRPVRDAHAPTSANLGTAPLPATWRGYYEATDLRMILRITDQTVDRFAGTIDYEDEGVVNGIAGSILRGADRMPLNGFWLRLGPPTDVAVVFREREQLQVGRRNIHLSGEYWAFVDGFRMRGGWISKELLAGRFSLVAE
jgi:hypothetical protein